MVLSQIDRLNEFRDVLHLLVMRTTYLLVVNEICQEFSIEVIYT